MKVKLAVMVLLVVCVGTAVGAWVGLAVVMLTNARLGHQGISEQV